MNLRGDPASGRWDAIVVGAGHNGLVAGFYLARGGLRTLILERRDFVGGACVTEEFALGFRASPGAYVLSMLRPQIWRDMRLKARGLKVSQSGPSLNVFPDGRRFTLHDDTARAVDEVRGISPADANAFPRFERHFKEVARALIPLYDRRAFDPRLAHAEDLKGAAVAGWLGLRNRRSLQEIAYLFATSATQILDEFFESEEVKSALGWEAISNTLSGPSTPGTAYRLLHEAAVSGGAGGGVGWGFVEGGMGVVTALMADAAREAGATIRTAAEVDRLIVRDGTATGVVVGDGEELRARVVLSNADPKRTFLGLVPQEALPEEFVARVRAYKSEGASMKINLAVSELPQISSEGGGDRVLPYHRGLIQFTKFLRDLDGDQQMAARGEPAPEPHIELCIPTVHDPSLAPEGAHVVTLGVRSQPYSLAGKSWDDTKDAVADSVIDHLTTFMPKLRNSILHREVLTPLDLERRLGLTGGHHMHGDMSPDQLFFLRPIRGYGGYRTPIRRLYLCGAGTHPGGGVSGANGRNAAATVLKDVKRRRR
jgi:phytoene dehydrogenase-like protein